MVQWSIQPLRALFRMIDGPRREFLCALASQSFKVARSLFMPRPTTTTTTTMARPRFRSDLDGFWWILLRVRILRSDCRSRSVGRSGPSDRSIAHPPGRRAVRPTIRGQRPTEQETRLTIPGQWPRFRIALPSSGLRDDHIPAWNAQEFIQKARG